MQGIQLCVLAKTNEVMWFHVKYFNTTLMVNTFENKTLKVPYIYVHNVHGLVDGFCTNP